MALPLISKTDLVNSLANTIPVVTPRIEISDEYPNDETVIRYGVFVSDVSTIEKVPYKLGVTYGGSIYTCTDEFEVLYVSYQDDNNTSNVTNAIQNLSGNLTLMNGYHEIDFTQSVELGSRAEKRTYTFQIKRLEFLT